jgi:succinyl-CoA synthetase beta subunit
MNIHEYQAKELLARFGVAVPRGKVAFSPEEAARAAEGFLAGGNGACVVKAQIHAGGRGKAGGVKLVRSAAEAASFAKALIGAQLVTHQTGPAGRVVKKVLVEEGCLIERELYVGAVVDRSSQRVAVMASAEGGVEIEEVAARSPEKIFREYVDPSAGLMPYQARKLAFAIGLGGGQINKAVKFITALYAAFVSSDCSMAEINPLVVTKSGDVMALDAKMSFDDNSLFRHKDIESLRDVDEEDPRELAASRFGLNYVSLDGRIGCMVNGAGLAMATMDMIKLRGGSPANFLDVGGGANREQVTEAFKLLVSDEKVSAVLVNIFGGIMRCDIIAEGIMAAAKDVGLRVPLVVRLQGTNVEEGRRLLASSNLDIITAERMDEAAEKAVRAAGRG